MCYNFVSLWDVEELTFLKIKNKYNILYQNYISKFSYN